MAHERFFNHIFKIFLVLNSLFLDPDLYQSLAWIRIRNKFFHIMYPDPDQNNTDPPHWFQHQRFLMDFYKNFRDQYLFEFGGLFIERSLLLEV